ncbi:nucleoside-diphosphate sugar epimerase [Solibacillus sp. FSL H8-0538]|uniref:nucleoside-diphosphate sugar epimerase n=1 Tax=Solibacillus sp. FSL H8-0538 TaxID=2921400 RepID=UPI0030F8AC4F
MELQALQKKLAKQLTQNLKVRIVQEDSFCIPVHTLQVSYHPVQRTAMDILMKMMLISFSKAEIEHVETLAHILLVEPLFINDLTNKMVKTGIITKETGTYQLTSKGEQQLVNGIFEEELELTSRILQYSTVHKAILHGDIEEVLEFGEFPELFAYLEQEELGDVDNSLLISELVAMQDNTDDDDTPQTYITSIASTEELQINDVPYVQFVLYEAAEDRYFARIYNTLTNSWDEVVEQLVNEKERTSWREKFA